MVCCEQLGLADQSVRGLPCVGENRPSFGVCFVAIKQSPLEGRDRGGQGLKWVGAVVLPKSALPGLTRSRGQSCSC